MLGRKQKVESRKAEKIENSAFCAENGTIPGRIEHFLDEKSRMPKFQKNNFFSLKLMLIKFGALHFLSFQFEWSKTQFLNLVPIFLLLLSVMFLQIFFKKSRKIFLFLHSAEHMRAPLVRN